MLVLDTSVFDARDRADAFQDSLSEHCTSSMATFESRDRVWAEVHMFDLGPAKVLTIDASGTLLRRTPRMTRGMHDCPIALALPMRTLNRLQRNRDDQVFDRRDMMLVDLSAPYVYGWQGDGASYAFHVDLAQLDLRMDVVRAAMPDLQRSPIYGLVRDHMVHVTVDAAEISASGAAQEVGAASVELMRALIVSAAGESREAKEALHAAVRERVQAYVRHHLRDPDLSPARIAAANAVSPRELYRIYERLGLSLEGSIIEQRLHGARTELATPEAAERSIASIALSWGFANPSFFTDRFRRLFGTTPRQWRESMAAARSEVR